MSKSDIISIMGGLGQSGVSKDERVQPGLRSSKSKIPRTRSRTGHSLYTLSKKFNRSVLPGALFKIMIDPEGVMLVALVVFSNFLALSTAHARHVLQDHS